MSRSAWMNRPSFRILLSSGTKQFNKRPPARSEVRIRTLGDDSAVFQHKNRVAVRKSRKTMSHHQNRLLPQQNPHRLHDSPLRRVIEGAGGFVEYDDVRIAVQGPRNADALTLTAAKANTSFTDHRVVTVRQFIHHKVIDLRDLSSIAHGLHVDIILRYTKGNVLRHRGVRQKNVLRDVSDALLPCLQVRLVDDDAVDHNLAFLGLKQAEDDVYKRRFTGTRRAYKPYRRVGRNFKRNAIDGGSIGVGIGKPYSLQFQLLT